MSDGTGACYVWLQFWPGFTDKAPLKKFDAAASSSPDEFLQQLVNKNSGKIRKAEAVRRVAREKAVRERRSQSLVCPPGAKSAPSRSAIISRRPTSEERLEDALELLGWRRGSYQARTYGGGASDGSRFASPRIWLFDLPPEVSAEVVIAKLEFSAHDSKQRQELRSELCPRYGFVEAASMTVAEIARCEEGIRQFWEEPNGSYGNWYRFARQLHPNRTAVLRAAGVSEEIKEPSDGGLGGTPDWIVNGLRNGALRHTDDQKREMQALQESIHKARVDKHLTPAERIAFEAQQLVAYSQIVENPMRVPLDERCVLKKESPVDASCDEDSQRGGSSDSSDLRQAARNDWYIERKLAGDTWDQICEAQTAICPPNRWRKVGNADAVYKAAKLRAKARGIYLPRGKGGRPKSQGQRIPK